ncbi:hypothetical protein ACJJTC_007652 [Scirpophaga incertulas]
MKADTNNLSSNLKSAPRKYIILDKMFHATKMLFPCVIFKQNSCRLQHHCTFLKTHNPSNADFLFPSKDDEVQREQQQRPEIKKKRTSSPAQSTSRAKYAASHQTEPVQKKKKTVINPVHMKKRTTCSGAIVRRKRLSCLCRHQLVINQFIHTSPDDS